MITADELVGLPVTDDPASWALSQMAVPPTGEPAYKIGKAWDALLVPALTTAGFTGKGRDFFRGDGAMTAAVNLQSFHHGHSFTIELGLDPWRGGEAGPASVKTITAPFRARLHEGGSDLWWTYGRDRASMEAAATAAATICSRHLDAAFAEITRYISNGDAAEDSTALGLFGLNHVDIARYRNGKSDRASAADFARAALTYLAQGTAIHAEMTELAAAR